MEGPTEIDTEEIVARIRNSIRQRNRLAPLPRSASTATRAADGQVSADLAVMHANHDLSEIRFTSHRRIIGRLVVFAKTVLQKLLTPILLRQSAHNAAVTRLVTRFEEGLEALDHRHTELRQELMAAHGQALEQLDKLVQQQTAHGQALDAVRARLDGLAQQQTGHGQALDAVRARLDGLTQQQTGHGQALDAVRARLDGLTQQQTQLQHAVESHQAQALQLLRERASRAERTLRRVLHDGGMDRAPAARLPEMPREAPALESTDPGFDYFGFEERFRGSEDEVKDRQRGYVKDFEERGPVLDVGCGRGEFLELLREAGIEAHGVDLDLDMVLCCREKELDVVMRDAFVHLETLPDESLGGIFSAQFIEHLSPEQVIRLVRLAHRKLRAGGILLLETPNPRCLMVFAESFYMDLTHTRPFHPEAMRFVLESAGFLDVHVTFSSPVGASMRLPSLPVPDGPEALAVLNGGLERLNNLLFGFQDYAVVGRKRETPLPRNADLTGRLA